jgi:V8-like Glu-specific endopeptidase
MANGSGFEQMADEFSTQGQGMTKQPSPSKGAGPTEASEFISEESAGDTPIPSGTEGSEEAVSLHDEVSSPGGGESGEEFYEATPEQLESSGSESGEEAGEEGLFDVIGGLVGSFIGGEASEFGGEAGEYGSEAAETIAEVGTAIESGQEAGAGEEFLPILAALAPTLISTVGPMVSKAVMGRLSPRARSGVKRIAARVKKPSAAPVVKPSAALVVKPPAASVVKPSAAPVVKPSAAPGKPVVKATGRPVRKPSGNNLLAILAKLLLEAAEKSGSESGAEVGEEFTPLIDEAAAALEVIIDVDNRMQVTNTAKDPWRRICALRITFPTGKTYRGTGFLIGRRAVVTAGHCVYLHNDGGWAKKIEVIPGSNGTLQPYGAAVSTTFRSVSGWVKSKKPESDYGCILLPSGAFEGKNLGAFGFAALDGPKLLAATAYLSGYPGDKPFAELWGMKRKLKTVTSNTLVYDIDTMGGQSGAPVYCKVGGKRYVVGIHNYGQSSGNSATRVIPPVYDLMKKWSSIN